MKEEEEEEEGMLENKNSSTPTTSHKSRIWKSDAVPKPHKSNTSIVAVDDDDDDDDDKEEIFEAKTLDTRELKTDKGEDKSMSSSLCRGSLEEEESGRERLKRHRVEVAGQVWIPDTWDQEDLLKDWTDCSAFDSSLVPQGIISARAALAEAATPTPTATARRRTHSGRLGVENSC